MASLSPARFDEPDAPATPDVLRGVARALDQLGVLVLQLAAAAEKPAEADPLLTVPEAAAELRCSERQIRAACRGRLILAQQRPYRIRLSALRDYERRRMVYPRRRTS